MGIGALLTHGTLSTSILCFDFLSLVVRVSFPFVFLGGVTGAYAMGMGMAKVYRVGPAARRSGFMN